MYWFSLASQKLSTSQTPKPYCICLQRGRNTVDSPGQLPATPLAPSVSGSPHESRAAVTPAASLQGLGSGSSPPARGSSSQPLLAAALARAAEGNSPSPHSTVAGISPVRAPALPASAAGAAEPNSPRSRASLRPSAATTQEAATAAGDLAQARNPKSSSGEQPGALSRQEDATSSASFDSWHSRNHQDSTTTASTSKPADATAVGPSRKTPIAADAVDAQGSSLILSVSLVEGLFWHFWHCKKLPPTKT